MFPPLQKNIEVWEKSASEQISSEEIQAAAKEKAEFLYPTLVLAHPGFSKWNPPKNELKSLGQISYLGKYSPTPFSDIIRAAAKEQLGIEFDPTKHLFVSVALQVFGTATGIIFEIPE